MIARACMLLLLVAFDESVCRADSIPLASQTDARIRSAIFNPNEVYRLYGRVGYAIELIFEDGESGVGQAGGDLDAIAFGWHENHLMLKPKAPVVGTNLVIYTSRRTYRFDYMATSRKLDALGQPVMYAVHFSYAAPYAKAHVDADSAEARASRALSQADPDRSRNFDYWYCGSAALKPTAASDDGVHTRLSFASRGEVPAVFVRNEDGTESLLNFSMEGSDMVIHRVAPKFILRRGMLSACVVNQGYRGSGERLPSGTVASGVQRERQEVVK